MKDTWIILRIVLSLVAIFALGIWVGRKTAQDGLIPPSDLAVEFEAGFSHKKGTPVTSRVMKRYQTDLRLSAEQMDLLRPAFEKATLRIGVHPRASRERMAVIKDFHQEMEPHLTPKQQEKARKILELMEARKQR